MTTRATSGRPARMAASTILVIRSQAREPISAASTSKVAAERPTVQPDARSLAHRRGLLAWADALLDDPRSRAPQQTTVLAFAPQSFTGGGIEREPAPFEIAEMAQLRLDVVPLEAGAPVLQAKAIAQRLPRAVMLAEEEYEKPMTARGAAHRMQRRARKHT